ncbi:MAG: fructose-bisphosphatase, class II [Nitrospinae bacterium RIFCSPLOWO2_12_FULL_45_22]|nr:MAG: fructose-bisphosphatase, class II [Nitrospinae bacterium RIFCSPLOWO2_12_FULL_45_22]
MEQDLALESVRVTEAAALACARLMGQGDEHLAYYSAVEAMSKALKNLPIKGTIAIGAGEPEDSPQLYGGEQIGSGDFPEVEIALNPLEGTTICATGGPNSISVVAIGKKGSFFPCPDVYMEKIAVGPKARGVIDLNLSPAENLKNIADALGCYIEDLTVVILNRPRHQELIQQVRGAGARIKLIGDGDVSAAIATALKGSGVDILMGIGGAKQGVLAAAALKCLKGDIQGRLCPQPGSDIPGPYLDKVLTIDDLVKGENISFAATGITDGDMLKGVRFFSGGAHTYSLVMSSQYRTIRFIETDHYLPY